MCKIYFLDNSMYSSVLNRTPGIISNPNLSSADLGKNRKIKNDLEHHLEKRYSCEMLKDEMEEKNKLRLDFGDFVQEMSLGQQILFVIEKFEAVRNMQNAANRLFGCVLAINTGLMVFMVVVLKYILVWSFWNFLNMSESDNGDVAPPQLVHSHPEWAMFGILNLCFVVRLFVLVVCLGNVHFSSVKFNSKLSQALLQSQKIVDVVERQGISEKVKYFRGRKVITASEVNTVLIFITDNSANPMAFSAGGLFCFCRGLTLVILSIITTYLVFLLQV